MENMSSYYRPQTKLRKGNVSTPVSQSFCSQVGCTAGVRMMAACEAGECMVGSVAGGVHGGGMCCRGHAWQGACVVGACVAGGVCGRRDCHCSGRYVSYWNAFLFSNKTKLTHPAIKFYIQGVETVQEKIVAG